MYDCTRRVDTLRCVLKQVPLGGLTDRDRVETLNEASILRSARSKFVVAILDSWQDKTSDCLYIVMEHAGKDLSKVLVDAGGRLGESEVWRFLLPVALGLKHLHSLRILHRDLKPANVFTDFGTDGDKDESRRVVIGDLGLGRVLSGTTDFAKTNLGTPLYHSPELAMDKPYNDKSDVWAFGCLAHELLTGRPPFEARNQLALAAKIVNTPTPTLPNHVSADLQFVIHSALTKDMTKRPSMADLLSLSCVRLRVEQFLEQNARKAARESRERRSEQTRFVQEERARLAIESDLLHSKQLAMTTALAELRKREQEIELATDLPRVREMAERVVTLESANAALAARLEDTEMRLADAERARVRLVGKLEQAVRAVASAAATPYGSQIGSPDGLQKLARGVEESLGVSPDTRKRVFSPLPSPPRDAPLCHDQDTAVDVDVADEFFRGPGMSWRERPGKDRYGERDGTDSESTEKHTFGEPNATATGLSAPPSPIAPASVTGDVSVDAENTVADARAPGTEKLVARSLNYFPHDSSFGSLASFGARRMSSIDDDDDDSIVFSDEDHELDGTAVSLEPCVSMIHSMSLTSTPVGSVSASLSRSNGFENTRNPSALPPPALALAFTHSVFRPIAPAPKSGARETEGALASCASSTLGKTKPKAVRPVARLATKGGVLLDLTALGVSPPERCRDDGEEKGSDVSKQFELTTPFVAVHAWRRSQKATATASAPAPLAPSPVGCSSSVWDNHAVVRLEPSSSRSFHVLFRVDGRNSPSLARRDNSNPVDTKRNKTTRDAPTNTKTKHPEPRRAFLRGRDGFVPCALSRSDAELRRVDGSPPWRMVEVVPSKGKGKDALVSRNGGHWHELRLEFGNTESVVEVLVLKRDARVARMFRDATGKETTRLDRTGAAKENDPLVVPADPAAQRESPAPRRWPGLAGGPSRAAAASPIGSPVKQLDSVGPRRETKTPLKSLEGGIGIFVEGHSPDGLVGVSFTPSDAKGRESDSETGGDESDVPVSVSPTPEKEKAWPLKPARVAGLLERASSGFSEADKCGASVLPGLAEMTPPTVRTWKERCQDESGTKETSDTSEALVGDDQDGAASTSDGTAFLSYQPQKKFKPEDRALVNDLLYQAQLLQDAVAAAAERLGPGPERFALTSPVSPMNKLGYAPPGVRLTNYDRTYGTGLAQKLEKSNTARPPSRARRVDLLRSIGYMASPASPSCADTMKQCDSPAMGTRGRRNLHEGFEEESEAEGFARERESVFSWRQSLEGGDRDQAGSPAFDESTSARRRRVEALLEPRVLF